MNAISHHVNSRRSSLISLDFYYHISLSKFSTNLERHHDHQSNLLSQKLQVENESKPISTTQTPRDQLIYLIKSCTQKTHLLQIHAQIIHSSLIQDSSVSLHFLSRVALSPVRDISYARKVFVQMPKPILSHYNTMIRACSMSNSPEEGFYMYRDLQRQGIPADPLSFSFAIKSCIAISSLPSGVQIHARIFRNGHELDSFLLTTLMDLYSCCQKFDEACKVFYEITKKDVVVWNVLVSCCIRNNRTRDALTLFEIMQSPDYRCRPDEVTCLLLLQACAHLNVLEFGERVHSYIEQQGYDHLVNLCNSLISMYSRCGCLDKAFTVFKGIRNKNVVSWSAMISGLAINGHGKEAIKAFSEMLKMGVQPDDRTFTGLLSACSHSGLINEGIIIFNQMKKEFGIVPNIHHYGCIVDLLGRTGRLDHAYNLIISMEITPDSKIWRILLGACRIHGHVNLGERVIEHLVELKAQEAGDYVLLLNMYSLAGEWEKVLELRKFMKEKAIQTTPGCSTIELKGVVHEFVVDDVSHPRKDEVYVMLGEINQQLKIAGYVAEIKSELHNFGAEEKGYALSYHSEKLAIAFGVLATPPGTTIRVAKSLRTCVDCHNFAKFLSSVYNRVIVIRDRNRFHHFREGRCSCGDYW